MEKVKVRIEPITAKEAAQREYRQLEFMTDERRRIENSYVGNHIEHYETLFYKVKSILLSIYNIKTK